MNELDMLRQENERLRATCEALDARCVDARERVDVLESWIQRAVVWMNQERTRRAYDYGLHQIFVDAPLAQPEPTPPAHSGVRVHNYAKEG